MINEVLLWLSFSILVKNFALVLTYMFTCDMVFSNKQPQLLITLRVSSIILMGENNVKQLPYVQQT